MVLLYPAATVFQLIGSLSVPIGDLPADRKIFFDWGFQMNYNMPFNLSEFRMIPIWPRHKERRSSFSKDFSARELYEGMEYLLESYGFDKSCLKWTICDFAQHPFDNTQNTSNIIMDIINFLLKPSAHQGFSKSETLYKIAYEAIELDGHHMGQNCQQLQQKCQNGFLNLITKIIYN